MENVPEYFGYQHLQIKPQKFCHHSILFKYLIRSHSSNADVVNWYWSLLDTGFNIPFP